MEIRQLRYFVAVAEELHFRRAAARLHIAQPPLSQQIRRLERDLDAQLFHRNNRNVRLTEAGEVLLREIRPLLVNLDKAAILTRRVSRGQTGRLSIAFIHSATYSILPLAVRAFRERYPDVELSLQEMQITHQLDALSRDEIQIGVLRPPVNVAGIITETLQTEALLAALPADHALASRPTLSLRDLAEFPFVMARRNRVGFFDGIKSLCRNAGFEPRVSQEATDMHTVVSLVSVGLGIALVPETIKYNPATNVVYRHLDEKPTTALALAWRAGRTSPALEGFVELTRQTNSRRR